VTDEFERTWKQKVVAYSRYRFNDCTERLKKTAKTSVKLAVFWTRDLRNVKQEF